MGAWDGVGSAGIGIASGALGMIGQRRRERRSNRNQRGMMNLQYGNQRKLNAQGQQLQMKTWRDTGYGAQMEMMKDAGLNPALMYGQSGGGGQTTGSQGGGSAGSGGAAQPQSMDIAGHAQTAMTASTIALQKSQANKNEAEASSIRGEEGTKGQSEIAKMVAETTTEGWKQTVMEAEKWLKETQVNSEITKQNLNEEQRFDIRKKRDPMIQNMEKDLIVKGIQIKAQESGIKMNDARINEMWHKIRQEWAKAGFKGLDAIIGNVIRVRK